MTRADPNRLLDDLFAHAPVGLGLLDDSLRYVRVNEQLATMNGRPAAEHGGRTIDEVLGPEHAPVVRALCERVLDGEIVRDIEVESAGRRFRISYVPAELDDNSRGIWAIVVETTAALEAETALQATEQRLRLALEGTRTGAWEWDVEADAISWSPAVHIVHGLPLDAAPPSFEEYLQLVHPADRDAFHTMVARAVEQGTGYEHEFRVAWPDGGVHWLEVRAQVQRDEAGAARRLVGITSDITERRRREHATELLARAGLLLSESRGTEATLAELAQLVVPDLADWCTVSVPDDDAPGGLRNVAVAHADPGKVAWAREAGARYPPRADAPTGAGAVIRSGQAELYAEIPEALLEQVAVDDEHLRLLQTLQMRSVMLVPLIARGRALGAMGFVGAESGRTFTEHDLELAEELGRRAGLALDNARLLEAEREARRAAEEGAERIAVLQRVVELGLTHRDLDPLLEELLADLLDLTGLDRAGVVLRADDGSTFDVRAVAGFGELELPPHVRPGQGVTSVVLERGATVVYEDLAEAPLYDERIRDLAASLAAVPLRARGEVFGVLLVLSNERRTFPPGDLQLLELVAERAGQAIDHARLHEQARDTARTLQRALLPHGLPELPGLELAAHYSPGQDGTEVGGDWYDVFPMAGGAAGVAVGDVVGRGLRAAASMGQLRVALKAAAFESATAHEPVAQLHRFVEESGDADFATLALLVFDRGRRQARLCSAGHFAPVLVAPDGSAALAPVRPGPPIGADPCDRQESVFDVEPGTIVLLYTDGLVERREITLDERLATLVETAGDAPRDDLRGFLEHVLQGLGTGEQLRDDLAVIAVRTTG